MARDNAARIPVGLAPWHCDQNMIVCQHGHALWLNKSDYGGDMSRLAGHAFLFCQKCERTHGARSYFLAVFSTTPDAHVTCYALSQASFDEWHHSPLGTPSTPELLYLVRDPDGHSHNPYWRPPTAHR